MYSPGSQKKRRTPTAHERRHNHAHFHAHDKEIREIQEDVEKRAVGDEVTATIDGKVVTWKNDFGGGAAGTPAAGAPAAKFVQPQTTGKADASQPTSAPAADSKVPDIKGDWVRNGYYCAESQTLEGLVFLNHLGGSGSGTWRFVASVSHFVGSSVNANTRYSARPTETPSRLPRPTAPSPLHHLRSSPTPPSHPTTRSSS